MKRLRGEIVCQVRFGHENGLSKLEDWTEKDMSHSQERKVGGI